MRQICLRLPAKTLERLDEAARRQGATRSTLLRRTVDRLLAGELPAEPRDAPDRYEALELLGESARQGSVTARVALAKLLLHDEPAADPVEAYLAALRAQRS